jgi:hypothetical protein
MTRLVVVVALLCAAACVLAASPAQNRVCGTTAQQNEQGALDTVWNTYAAFWCARNTIGCKVLRQPAWYPVGVSNVELPGAMIADWQAVVRPAFQALVQSKLDPYDYAMAREVMDVDSPFSRPGMTPVCADALEEWAMFRSDQQAILSVMAYDTDATQYGPAYLQAGVAPVYDATTYAGLVAELDAYCPYTQARIAGDWWTAAYNYANGRGGLIPFSALVDQLTNMAFIGTYYLDSSLLTANPLVASVIARGYMPTAQELTDTYAAMDAAVACLSDYYDYTLAVAPPLAAATTDNLDWFNLRVPFPLNCTWEYATLVTGMTPARAQYLFDTLTAELDALVPQLAADMAAAQPTYLGYNLTFLHLDEAYCAANGTIAFLGYPAAEICDTQNVYANGTTFLAIEQAAMQKVRDNQQLFRTLGTQNRAALLPEDPVCGFLTERSAIFASPSGDQQNLPAGNPFVALWPNFFRETTTGYMLGEEARSNVLTFAAYSACPTCYARRYSSYTHLWAAYAGLGDSYGLGASTQLTFATPVFDGARAYVSNAYAFDQTNFYTPEERLDYQFVYARQTLLDAIKSLGYWAPLGWLSDDDCAVYSQNSDWAPAATYAAAVSECASRRLDYTAGSPNAMFTVNGAQYMRDYYAQAQLECGAAFDGPYFVSLASAHGATSLGVWRRIVEDYIGSGCEKTLTVLGDCWRVIAPPRVVPI